MDNGRGWKLFESKALVILLALLMLGIVAGLYVIGEERPPEYPDRPEELTNQSVEKYVSQSEEAVVYRERSSDATNGLSVSCSSEIDRVTHNNYYVIVRCHGSVNGPNGETATFGNRATFYRVRDNSTKRAPTNKRISVNSSSQSRGQFYIVNLDSQSQSIDVNLTRRDLKTSILDSSLQIPMESSIHIGQIPADDYTLSIQSEQFSLDEYDWSVSTSGNRSLVIYIEDNEIQITSHT